MQSLIESRTLVSRCFYWDKGEEQLKAEDILVVDEAGMLGSRQMARIFSEAEQSGAKIVLVGDPQQLQAIQAGAAFRAIVEQTSFVELTEIRRQQVPSQREATQEFARGQVEQALGRYENAQHLYEYYTRADHKFSTNKPDLYEKPKESLVKKHC